MRMDCSPNEWNSDRCLCLILYVVVTEELDQMLLFNCSASVSQLQEHAETHLTFNPSEEESP